LLFYVFQANFSANIQKIKGLTDFCVGYNYTDRCRLLVTARPVGPVGADLSASRRMPCFEKTKDFW
jgi:hypothetical protein